MYELPDDNFLGIETCSFVECLLLNRVVFNWRVLYLCLLEHCNTTGRLKISSYYLRQGMCEVIECNNQTVYCDIYIYIYIYINGGFRHG